MTKIHHLNCVTIESPMGGKAIGHCLLLEDRNGLALVDAGIGLLDMRQPDERLGKQLIEAVGFKFNEKQAAYRQIEQLGLNPKDVNHCIATHLDPDHIGALADFPNLILHVSEEELENFHKGNLRYLQHQLSHKPNIITYGTSDEKWYGLEARKISLGFASEIFLVPLFGHTLGHCGVAIQQRNGWVFHIGDAYYYYIETEMNNHPVSQLAASRADNNELRIKTLNELKKLISRNPEIRTLSFHDPDEFPDS